MTSMPATRATPLLASSSLLLGPLLSSVLGACSQQDDAAPAPAPVAAGVYFCSNRSGNFELFHLEGSTLTQLTNDSDFDSWWPRQAPDARSMLFYRSRVADRPASGGHNNNYEHAELWSLDLASGKTSLRCFAASKATGRSRGAADRLPPKLDLVRSGFCT